MEVNVNNSTSTFDISAVETFPKEPENAIKLKNGKDQEDTDAHKLSLSKEAEQLSYNKSDAYKSSQFEKTFETYNQKSQIINSKNKTNSVLPEKYDKHLQGYIYYKGERMTQYKFLEIAVSTGEYELDESQNINYNYSKAWKALVEDKAKPLYSWSSTLYSEDGMYVFRVENGQITGASATKLFNGTDIHEIANQLASGVPPSEIKGDISWLSTHDRELYNAATAIGNARRNYQNTETTYKNGEISHSQYLKELKPLFMILFGDSQVNENKLSTMKNYFTQNIDDYVKNAFENFNPQRYINAYNH